MNPPAVEHSASQCTFLKIILMADCVKECIFIFRGRGTLIWPGDEAMLYSSYICM